MSLQLLIDEDTQAKPLVRLLKAAGHDVLTINDLNVAGTPDDEVLALAQKDNRVILTRNCDDFKKLHERDPDHPGILMIYRNSDRSKNMKYGDVVRAINDLENAISALRGQCVVLDRWRY